MSIEEMTTVQEAGELFLQVKSIQDDYRIKMISMNDPESLVPAIVRTIDGEKFIYYKISGLTMLTALQDKTPFLEADLEDIFSAIEGAAACMEEYLLPFEDILLIPEYIFVGREKERKYFLIYLPGCEIGKNVREFIEYILDRVDYNDDGAVRQAYSLYQKTREKGFDFGALRMAIREIRAGRSLVDEKKEVPRIRTETLNTTVAVRTQKETLRTPDAKKESIQNIKGKILAYVKELIAKLVSELYHRYGNNDSMTVRESVSKEVREDDQADDRTTLLSATTIRGGVYALRAKSKADEDILLLEYPFFIGKERAKMDFEIDDDRVSRYHARIDRNGEQFYVTDLNSTNGTFHNRIRLDPFERVELKEGDLLVFAAKEYEFCFLY